jgi:hypothetical protein
MRKKDKIKKNSEIFDDLDAYRQWCVEFGCFFDEADLYRPGTTWSLYQRARHGDRSLQSNWDRDRNRLPRNAQPKVQQ